MRPLRSLLSRLALAALLATPAATFGATIVLDGSAAGGSAVYDAIGDGWFFAGGPSVPPDGVGDSGGNALAVALRSGQADGNLELRGVAEFPLGPLAGLAAADIDTATLTFYVDDVVGTFGPGADFDGTAADAVVLFGYAGNGMVETTDFGNVTGAPLASVATSATANSITDASLASSGPLQFDVDVKALLQSLLTGTAPALGTVFTTNDNLTATSIDGLSPPGVLGAVLPFITVTTVPDTPPVLSSDAQKCVAGIAKAASKLAAAELKAFGICFNAVLKDYAPDSMLGAAAVTKCAGQLDEASPDSKLAKAVAKFSGRAIAKCGSLTPADIGSPCDGSAVTLDDTLDCVRAAHQTAAENLVATQYPSACNILDAVGLSARFPGVCLP
jgi:hypothetical protein